MTPRPVEVTLCWSEMVFCALAGALFQIQNLRHGTRDKHLGSRSELEHPWELHIEAAMTELLVARHLGTYWTRPHALGDKTAMDGVGYEVRGTPRADGHLIIHEPDKSNDRPETPFVLVTYGGRPRSRPQTPRTAHRRRRAAGRLAGQRRCRGTGRNGTRRPPCPTAAGKRLNAGSPHAA